VNFIIKTTDNCNFSCKYCITKVSSKKKFLDEAVYNKFIKHIPDYMKLNADKNINIVFHGGEPLLLSSDYYEKIFETTALYLKKFNVGYNIQTNGYLINEKWLALFKKYNVNISISIDGPSFFHDKIRTLKDSSPTNEVIVENIKKLKFNAINTSIIMVFNKIHIGKEKEVFEFFKQTGLDVKINPLINYESGTKANEYKIKSGDYSKFLINIFKIWVADFNCDIKLDPLYNMLMSVIKDVPMTECSYSNSCGKDFMCLNSDGSIFTCGRFSNIESESCGYISESGLVDIYNSNSYKKLNERRENLLSDECGKCKYSKFCNGGCAFEAFVSRKNLNSRSSSCKDTVKIFDFLYSEGLPLFKDMLLKVKAILRARLDKNIKKQKVVETYV